MSSHPSPSTIGLPYSYDRAQLPVLLLEGIHPSAVDHFKTDGYADVTAQADPLRPEELAETIADYSFLGIRSRTKVTEEVLEHAERLVAIGCFGAGTNQVDLTAAKLRGIPVFNAPYANTRSVAEYVIGCTISLLRGLSAKNVAAHRGEWRKSARRSHEIRGKTMGVIGYGNIGMQVGVMAESLGMHVVFFDPTDRLPLGNAVRMDTMEEVLRASTVVTLHVPDTPATRGMIGAEQLALMPAGAHLINAARGALVDVEALADSITAGHLGGAALDVFTNEPKAAAEPFESPLKGLDQVILTPHIGGSTEEAQEAIGRYVATKLTVFSNTGVTEGCVNMAQVRLPSNGTNHRLLHIHRNEPGVLSALNRVLSESDINIEGQVLKTDAEVGYVVTDIDQRADGADLLQRIRAVPGTIRARLLY